MVVWRSALIDVCPLQTCIMLDVAIIGAGPAGLAAAAALIRCTSNPVGIQVFDHIQKFEVCGAGLAVRSNGYAALGAINPTLPQKVADLVSQQSTTVMHSLDGKVLRTMVTPQNNAPATPRDTTALGWSELRDALADEVPSSNINLSKRLSHLVMKEDAVTLHFTDKSTVDAKVVVGADGCFSKVRQQTLADGLPDHTGTTMWRARLKSKDPCNETHILSGGKLLAVYYAIGTQGQLVWTVSASQAHLEEAGLSARHGPSQNQNSNCKENQSPAQHAQHAGLNEQEQAKGNEREDASAKERCKKVWGNRSKLVSDLIDATDDSTILEHNMYIRHPDSLSQGHWGKGRVTLVGDAAHPMRPASGQGMNQALEDAVELAQAIKQGGFNPSSLRSFESSRIPRLQEIMAAEMVLGLKAYAGCPEEMPEALRCFKHATALWHGTDAGEYNKWAVKDRSFAPLSAE
ncbi:hypothetical protein ABBQ32_006859 [Trebouxia sp. C0010 RCD-2024]